ncbi:MAG: hypothetical protein JSV08_08960 [Acidobacteriota bacterium]|nr:MAG: hypothetical protein JSV08_08960 [Acidobacteriota bacterium]
MSHVGLMVLYMGMISLFFGTLLRNDRRAIAVFAVKMFLILLVASLAVAWILAPFPR